MVVGNELTISCQAYLDEDAFKWNLNENCDSNEVAFVITPSTNKENSIHALLSQNNKWTIGKSNNSSLKADSFLSIQTFNEQDQSGTNPKLFLGLKGKGIDATADSDIGQESKAWKIESTSKTPFNFETYTCPVR